MSVKKYNEGGQPHKMSLLIDVELSRPIEVEVSYSSSHIFAFVSAYTIRTAEITRVH